MVPTDFVEGERYALLFPSASVHFSWLTNRSFLRPANYYLTQIGFIRTRVSVADKFRVILPIIQAWPMPPRHQFTIRWIQLQPGGGTLGRKKQAQIVSWDVLQNSISLWTHAGLSELTLNAEYFHENHSNILKTPSHCSSFFPGSSFLPQSNGSKNQGVSREVGWDHKIKTWL